ncbi:MAG: peptidylprolyl isomerase [Pseudomonadota bacterium]
MADIKDPENTLVLDTTKGPITIQLLPEVAPNHVDRLKTLAREGFYDGIVFHRVIDGFMAQTGCPQGRGTGGSDHPDLDQEFNATPHERGTCSMARTSDPNSANSQWFICFDKQEFLDRQYTVWGQVIDGMDAVDALAKGEPPRNPDAINSMKVAADA